MYQISDNITILEIDEASKQLEVHYIELYTNEQLRIKPIKSLDITKLNDFNFSSNEYFQVHESNSPMSIIISFATENLITQDTNVLEKLMIESLNDK